MVNGIPFVVTGHWPTLLGVPETHEDYHDIDDPQAVIATVTTILRGTPDLFTFWQRLPDTTPRYPYHREWDNVAALPITSYADWFDRIVHPSVRTKLRKATRSGVSVDVASFDEEFVRSLAEIFNETPIRQGRPYAHYGQSLDQIRTEWSSELHMSAF